VQRLVLHKFVKFDAINHLLKPINAVQLQLVDCSDVMTSPVECLNMSETVNRLTRIIDDPQSHNGYPVVEDYCPASVRILFDGGARIRGGKAHGSAKFACMSHSVLKRENIVFSLISH